MSAFVFKASIPTMKRTLNGVAWNATLYCNDRYVAEVQNKGDGSADSYHWATIPDQAAVWDAYVEAAAVWLAANPGMPVLPDRQYMGGRPVADYCSSYFESLMQEAERGAR